MTIENIFCNFAQLKIKEYICDMDIERIQWWVEAESIKRKIRADRERLDRIEVEEKLFCRETKTKTNDKDDKTNHENQVKG